jgi:hypothetical protein
LRRQLGGFIGSKVKRNQYRKTEPNDGRKSSRKKTQPGEEGRKVFSESFEEKPREEDPLPGYRFCIYSILPVAQCLRQVSPFSLGRLIDALTYVRDLEAAPGTYVIGSNDCVTKAMAVGNQVGVSTGFSGGDACLFSVHLNLMWFDISPGPPVCDCIQ